MVAPEIKSEAAILVQEFCGLGVCWLNVWDALGHFGIFGMLGMFD